MYDIFNTVQGRIQDLKLGGALKIIVPLLKLIYGNTLQSSSSREGEVLGGASQVD